eukprot:6190185-Pleurochrysis_carterae.AAC.4
MHLHDTVQGSKIADGSLGELVDSYENEVESILRDASDRVKRFQQRCQIRCALARVYAKMTERHMRGFAVCSHLVFSSTYDVLLMARHSHLSMFTFRHCDIRIVAGKTMLQWRQQCKRQGGPT